MQEQETNSKLRADLTAADRERALKIGRIDFQSAGATRKNFDYVAAKRVEPEKHMPPHAAGTVKLLRERGHTVTVRCNRNGSLRYTLNAGRERNALELSNRLRRLHGVG